MSPGAANTGGLDKTISWEYTERQKGRCQQTVSPLADYRSNRSCWGQGRLLLFAVMYLQEQAANADDNQTELKQLRIRQHGHPLLSSEGQEVPSGMERPTACRYRQR